jgi:hypothetical protein
MRYTPLGPMRLLADDEYWMPLGPPYETEEL